PIAVTPTSNEVTNRLVTLESGKFKSAVMYGLLRVFSPENSGKPIVTELLLAIQSQLQGGDGVPSQSEIASRLVALDDEKFKPVMMYALTKIMTPKNAESVELTQLRAAIESQF